MKSKLYYVIWIVVGLFLTLLCALIALSISRGDGLQILAKYVFGAPPEPPMRAEIVPIETNIVLQQVNSQLVVCRYKIRVANIGSLATTLLSVDAKVHLDDNATDVQTSDSSLTWGENGQAIFVSVWGENPPFTDSYLSINSAEEAARFEGTRLPYYIAEHSTVNFFIDVIVDREKNRPQIITLDPLLTFSDIEPLEIDPIQCLE